MRRLLLLVLGCLLSVPAAAALYRHVDETGMVTYSDRPQQPHQEPLRLPPPNVATPEARRQLEIARQTSEREQQLEYEARIRRWGAAQRGAPASYARPSGPQLSPYAPRYASAAYYPYYYPSFNTFIAGTNAGSPSQSHPPQGLRPTGFSHRTGNARH